MTTVYTDGACLGNPGPGGWAWAVGEDQTDFGGEKKTTNQRMELTAVLEAISSLPGPLQVISDSTYVVDCFHRSWWRSWKAKGWTNSKNEPVANQDLWKPIIEEVLERGNITFRWVKGHSGDPMNELVDRLAVAAANDASTYH